MIPDYASEVCSLCDAMRDRELSIEVSPLIRLESRC